MALLFIDSFDHYDTATATAKGWSYTGTVSISASNGRNSTNALRIAPTSNQTVQAELGVSGVTGATCVVGFAYKRPTLGSVSWPIVSIMNGSTQNITLNITSTGAIEIRRGGRSGTLLETSVTTLNSATYYFLELKVLLHDSTGTYEVKIDGVSEMSDTGVDTIASGSAAWTGVSFVDNGGAVESNAREFDFDDLYICDGSGGVEDDFLGDHRIVAIVASSGSGTNVDWTTSTGSDHGALVDENPPNTSDYVYSDTSGDRDTFNFAAVGVAGTVKALQHVNYVSAQVAGIRSMGPVSRIGGVNYDGTGTVVGSDWTYQRDIKRVSPATSSAWTVSEIDGAEFGVKVTA